MEICVELKVRSLRRFSRVPKFETHKLKPKARMPKSTKLNESRMKGESKLNSLNKEIDCNLGTAKS